MKATTRARAPSTPVTKFVLTSSVASSSAPATKSRNAMFGSDRRWRAESAGSMGTSMTAAPSMSSVTVPVPKTSTWRPSASARTSSIVAAIPSTAPASSASVAEYERASATVETAQSTGRPCASASARIDAIASSRTFTPIVPGMSPPLLVTGAAAPMFVRGSHVREMRGERDERAGARGSGARGSHPDDDRQRRLEERLLDLVHRDHAAAGRVELDDHRVGAIGCGAGDPLAEIAGHRAVDDAGGDELHDVGPRTSLGEAAATTGRRPPA